jgi:hypothetical protein
LIKKKHSARERIYRASLFSSSFVITSPTHAIKSQSDDVFLGAAYRKRTESSPVSPLGKQSEEAEVEVEALGEKCEYIGDLRI